METGEYFPDPDVPKPHNKWNIDIV